MESDQELISQIRKLREIKPDAAWSASVRAQIVGHDPVGQKKSIPSIFGDLLFQYRIAFASLAVFLMVGGAVAAAQNALPGEPLYAIKRATERELALIAGKGNVASANLELAAKRLAEIDLITQKNMAQNLPAAIEEYKNAKAAAKKIVAAQIAQNPENAAQIVKNAAAAMKDINDKEKQIYGSLGVEANATSTDDGSVAASDKAIIASLIDGLKDNTGLSEDQLKDLQKVIDQYGKENYRQALDIYLNSSLNK